MHSRKKGKSGSKHLIHVSKPTWVRHKSKEIELLVIKLAKEGKSGSQIGLVLRDSYGVPDVHLLTGKSISQILADKHVSSSLPEDLGSLMRHGVLIRKHLAVNKHDMTALRGMQLNDAKIKRLAKYYKHVDRIPQDWKYEPDSVTLKTD